MKQYHDTAPQSKQDLIDPQTGKVNTSRCLAHSANPACYEEDHLISLEDGGDPKDPKNLWPQPRHTTPWNASQKDTLENVLHQLVCSNQIPLDEARQALAKDWVA